MSNASESSAARRTSALRRHWFGSFELQPNEQRLLKDGVPLQIGPRALEILEVLVETGGRLVTKDALLDRVWPSTVVVDSALRVHVSALRKVLGPDAISTVTGRGYRFVLPVVEVASQAPEPTPSPHNLSSASTSFIGRDKEIGDIRLSLERTRLPTLTGEGGSGKTRLSSPISGQTPFLHGLGG